VLLMGGHPDMAVPLLRNTAKETGGWSAFSNLGVALRQTGDYEGARKAFEEALRLNLNSKEVWHNLSSVHTDIGDFDRAYQCLCGARKLAPENPEIALAMAYAMLRRGDWEHAWPLWELGRFNNSWQPIPKIPVWSGEDLKGKKILVMQEGGYGDTFLFMRFLPELQDRGATVSLVVWDKQAVYLEGHPWINEVLPLSKPFDARKFDYQIAMMSIPSWLHLDPKKIPTTDGGYLWAELERAPYFHSGSKPLVGLCWAAEENGVPRKNRSIPIEALEPLKNCAAEFVSLCPGVDPPKWIPQFVPGDWRDTASLIAHLDMVVTVDTAVAHLAGAMDKETIVLLPTGSDWKWFTGTDTSPWYKSVKLIRSVFPDRWDGVIAEVAKQLRTLSLEVL
jgi:hypothetical protein